MSAGPTAQALDPLIVAGLDYGNPDPEWMRIDWRRHLRSIELDGARVSYVDIGEGEPVLFVHGLSGCWRNWLENLPHLAATGRRAIALDLPGFGSSPMPGWEIDMPSFGRLIGEFCEALGLAGTTLVGNSMGGFIALEAVTERPDLFERLALVAAAGIINTWNPEGRATVTALGWKIGSPMVADRGAWILARPHLRWALLSPYMRYPNRLRPELLWEQLDGGARCPGFGDALLALIRRDIREKLAAIEMPTLIVWGLSDRVIPVAAAVSYHRRIPHSRLEVFERTGHVPQLERPRRFNMVLDDFLAEPLPAG